VVIELSVVHCYHIGTATIMVSTVQLFTTVPSSLAVLVLDPLTVTVVIWVQL